MLPQIGKLDTDSFNRLIFPYLGSSDPRVLVGPRHGVDAAVIALDDAPAGRRRVMVVAEDPTFGLPSLMPYFGWSIAHICASDVAVLGIRPQYLTICLLLPPGTTEQTLELFWHQLHEECRNLGITIVGGHTGVAPGIGYPLNGGCTVWGFGTEAELTPASAARPGDRLVITKGPAVEATAILALQAGESLEKSIGKETAAAARRMFYDMTVVPDALLCRRYARAMHDATEGGLLGGVYEMAEAAGIGVTVYEKSIVISEPVRRVCAHFNIDPLISISEGTLVAAVPPDRLDELKEAAAAAQLPVFDIGEFTDRTRVFVRQDGTEEPLLPVREDPFWAAYFATLQQ
ncbi:MAG: AIR synthase family protein [candidate division WOR-3 bacterium]